MKKLIFIGFLLPLLINAQVQLLPSISIGSLPNDTASVCPTAPRSQENSWGQVHVRDTMAHLNTISAQYGNQIECFVVYAVETHPTRSPMPTGGGNINPTNTQYNQPTAAYGERKGIVQDLFNRVNGTFVTLFHNERLSDYWRWKGWKRLCESMLKITTA